MTLSTGQLVQNRYRIDARLGQGGMGAVYRAWDLKLGRAVVVKENLVHSEEAQRRFGREAGLLASLRHPNLPRVTDYFFLPGQGQYLVIDYVEGKDLRQALARRRAMPEAQALEWIGQVLDALDDLHGRNIIHGDVKPANVKITPKGEVFLVNFGLTRVTDPQQETTPGARGATPGYAPPEQYGLGRTDARSDLYSVGATLYTLLTGQAPPDALELATGGATLAPPRQFNPAISPEAEAAILKAMQANPANRFQSAGQFRGALPTPPPPLEPVEPVTERPEPAPPPTREPASYSRVHLVWLIVAEAVVLVMLLALGVWILLAPEI